VITCRTFSDSKWLVWTPSALLRRWEQVRERAREFVANELHEEDVIALSESATGNSPYAFAITV